MHTDSAQILTASSLTVYYGDGPPAVDRMDLALHPGETVGLVGESGCGKSTVALSIMQLLPRSASIEAEQFEFCGRPLQALTTSQLNGIRGRQMTMIFQEPMSALNPTMTVGAQIAEGIRLHLGLPSKAARTRAVEMLKLVGVPSPDLRARQYPHELSGGMRQRVLVAIAVATEPTLVIADEPTTAVDVTVQAQILELLHDIQRRFGLTMLLITHDLGVVAAFCNRIVVMYAGHVVEEGSVDALLRTPRHPYTQALVASAPRIDDSPKRRFATIRGQVPDLTSRPKGCRFSPRCPHRTEGCEIPQELLEMEGRLVRCWRAEELADSASEAI